MEAGTRPDEQVLVVIGVGGMGASLARRLGSGRRLHLADFDEAVLDRVREELTDDGYDVACSRVDVGDRESATTLAREAADRGPITEVVHTAGVSPVQAPTEAVLRVDLLGTALVLEIFGEYATHGARCVVIASMSGHMEPPLDPGTRTALATTPADELLGLEVCDPERIGSPAAAYGLAKQANHVRVRAAAAGIWGEKGGRVNSVSPGIVSTAMGRAELTGENGRIIRDLIDGSPCRRLGTPADVTDAAAFLLGPESSYITGTDLLVDGGVVASLGM